ncbi:hypothetical protein Pmani_028734 [Petrolisthes manimaculis]|uniref:Uncharacterized protein n=1 Tax=Petrolisthes manimaculis TaxID=1843537 RepID=A0AAE1TVC6_9EUCA|nr:hypothetical protein Pmani_038303 [Petrolisthes manimaculis]KAK4298956.1 hypothetical protein Pmani_028734 [Petrolisthes manimaculis]
MQPVLHKREKINSRYYGKDGAPFKCLICTQLHLETQGRPISPFVPRLTMNTGNLASTDHGHYFARCKYSLWRNLSLRNRGDYGSLGVIASLFWN